MLLLHRGGRLSLNHRPPLWDVPVEKRKALRRQVLEQENLEADDLASARLMATHLADQRDQFSLPVALVLTQLSGALLNPVPWHLIFSVVFTLFIAAVVVFVARRARAGAAFLRRYP